MISILIPTKNRSDFLIRALRYYRDVGYKHWICIGDSSVGIHAETARRAVMYFKKSLRINYLECPELNIVACHNRIVELVTTPYIACVSDSGFLVPESLEKCVKFLDSHPDYSVAHGVGAVFTLKNDGPYGQIQGLSKYRALPEIEEDIASARLINHLNRYSVTMYCVYRLETWKKIWRYSTDIKDASFAGELLPCCLSVIYDKAKQLDGLYLVRHIHNQRYLLPNTFEWITGPDWYPSYQVFIDCLASALTEQDKITLEKARDIAKQAFSVYLIKGIVGHYDGRKNLRARAKSLLKPILTLRKILKDAKDSLFPLQNLTLSALKNHRSPFYKDFMPIYQIINNSSDSLAEITKDYSSDGRS